MVVLALGVGAADWIGLGPAPGERETGDPITDFPAQTSQSERSAAFRTAILTPTPGPPFAFMIGRVEGCVLTCRDVTATLYNQHDAPATGVSVYSRIYAGEDSMAEPDLLWQGKAVVGTIGAAATDTSTQRVELSLRETTAPDTAGG